MTNLHLNQINTTLVNLGNEQDQIKPAGYKCLTTSTRLESTNTVLNQHKTFTEPD